MFPAISTAESEYPTSMSAFPPETGDPPFTHLQVLAADNRARGRTYGFELAADWQPLSRWQVRASYAFLQMDLSLDKDSQDELSLSQEEENPHHQLVLRSHAELSRQLDLDLTGRYVDALPAQRIPAYLTLDLHLGWCPTDALELALVGRDLLDSPRLEFAPQVVASLPTWTRREFYGEFSYRF